MTWIDLEEERKADKARKRKLSRDMAKARRFPTNTCPASRHAQAIGEHLLAGEPYAALIDEAEHCGESILWTVLALYKARNEVAALRHLSEIHQQREGE